MDYAQALRCTVEPIWSSMNLEQRIAAMQAVENHIAQFEGRRVRTVRSVDMPPLYEGYYNHADSSYINLSPYALRTPEDALKTTFHEGRHAYQWDCIDKNGGFPQPILDQFREGFDNYIPPEQNVEAYENNFCEVDARGFENEQLKLLEMDRNALIQRDRARGVAYTEVAPVVQQNITENVAPTLPDQYQARTAASYDWKNQTTAPVMEREKVKIKGCSESETYVQDLRDAPMSEYDLAQYHNYFTSDSVRYRPSQIQRVMGDDLKTMSYSLRENNYDEYAAARSHFLDVDQLYREQFPDNARKAPDHSEEGENLSGQSMSVPVAEQGVMQSSNVNSETYGVDTGDTVKQQEYSAGQEEEQAQTFEHDQSTDQLYRPSSETEKNQIQEVSPEQSTDQLYGVSNDIDAAPEQDVAQEHSTDQLYGVYNEMDKAPAQDVAQEQSADQLFGITDGVDEAPTEDVAQEQSADQLFGINSQQNENPTVVVGPAIEEPDLDLSNDLTY